MRFHARAPSSHIIRPIDGLVQVVNGQGMLLDIMLLTHRMPSPRFIGNFSPTSEQE